jgi:hypothetical protein
VVEVLTRDCAARVQVVRPRENPPLEARYSGTSDVPVAPGWNGRPPVRRAQRRAERRRQALATEMARDGTSRVRKSLASSGVSAVRMRCMPSLTVFRVIKIP